MIEKYAWDKVYRPKDKRGLGVINLYIQNVALLLKHLHKLYTTVDLRWVRLIWDSYYMTKVPYLIFHLSDIYRAISQCTIQSRTTVLFWDDLSNGKIRKYKFPGLFYHTTVRWELVCFYNNVHLEDCFNLPLEPHVYIQYL